MKRANEIIASTFGWSVQEINDCRYQSTRTAIPLYTADGHYYCCPQAGKAPPRGYVWREYSDQFFASGEGRTLYVADMNEEAQP